MKEVISIQPGDVIVVTTPYILDPSDSDIMKRDLAEIFPDSANITLLSGGATLDVYREQGRYADVSDSDGVKRTLDTKTGKIEVNNGR